MKYPSVGLAGSLNIELIVTGIHMAHSSLCAPHGTGLSMAQDSQDSQDSGHSGLRTALFSLFVPHNLFRMAVSGVSGLAHIWGLFFCVCHFTTLLEVVGSDGRHLCVLQAASFTGFVVSQLAVSGVAHI